MARGKKGFTLIEMIIAMVLVAVMAGLGGPLLVVSAEAIVFRIDRAELEESGHVALARMSREIRRLRDDESVLSAESAVFHFVDAGGSEIRYRLQGSQLMRREGPAGSSEFALADHVNAIHFTYFDDGDFEIISPSFGLGTKTELRGVQARIEFQKGDHDYSVQTQIRPKNLLHETSLFS